MGQAEKNHVRLGQRRRFRRDEGDVWNTWKEF
jgi:hypothetical protein